MATQYCVGRDGNDDWLIREFGERSRTFGPYTTQEHAIRDAMTLARGCAAASEVLVPTEDGRGSRIYWRSGS